MAKLILMRVEDDTLADELVKGIPESHDGVETVGAFKVPTQFCECPPESRDKSGKSQRGKKFGWWIRACCGKPAKYGGLYPHNLLEPPTPNKPRYKQRYGVHINAYFD